MFRRTVLALLATVALLVAGAGAATAYDAPGYTTTVSDPTPQAGEEVTVRSSGATPLSRMSLVVTGDGYLQSYVATADQDGVATFRLTLPHAGEFTLTVSDADGQVVGELVVTASAAAGAPPASPAEPTLPATGSQALELAAAALAMVLAGAGAVLVARRQVLPPVRRAHA